MLVAMLRLDSVRAKVSRAEEHGRALKREIDAYVQSQPYEIIKQISPDRKRHGLAIRIRHDADLDGWALIAGDAIHNLRSALDHLVYAISVHELQSDPPPNEGVSAFLINDRPEDFRSKFWRIKALSADVRQVIESVQPYNRKHVTHPPLLAILRDFDDADKHRLLTVILTGAKDTHFTNMRNAPAGKTFEVRFSNGGLEDGSEIASILFPCPAPDLDYDFSLSLAIAVGHATGPTGVNMTTLDTLVNDYLIPEVKGVIGIVSGAVI